jgi:hypothetical protein
MVEVQYLTVTVSVGSDPDGRVTEVIILPKVLYVWDFPMYCGVQHPSSTGAQELLADSVCELLKYKVA